MHRFLPIRLLLALAAGGLLLQNPGGCTTPNVALALQQAALVSAALNFPGPGTHPIVFIGP